MAGLEPGGSGNEGDWAESCNESCKEQACLALYGQDKLVNVRIRPEPLNPMDLGAIAIDVDYGTGWTHVMLVILLLNYASICTH